MMHFAKLLFPAGISANFFGHMAYAMCPFFLIYACLLHVSMIL